MLNRAEQWYVPLMWTLYETNLHEGGGRGGGSNAGRSTSWMGITGGRRLQIMLAAG